MEAPRQVVAVLRGTGEDTVLAGAAALARLLRAVPVRLRAGRDPGGPDLAPGVDDGLDADEVLDALAGDGVVGAVLGASGEDALVHRVLTHAPVPLLVIPGGAHRPITSLHRVLLPLDGSSATAVEVRPLVRTLLDAGADVVAVHVFDPVTTPAFWDHAAHSHQTWTREFLRRHDLDRVRLDLRRGRPVEEVLAAAERMRSDVVLLGWGQVLDEGRAPLVRHALLDGTVPLLLAGSGPGTNDRHAAGPSSLAPSPTRR